MLKNKKAIYVLIPLNILIWGFFAYRFYTAYSDSGIIPEGDNMPQVKVESLKDSVTYRLNGAYKDPFLKDAPPKRINPQAASVEKPPAKVAVKIETPVKTIPEIKYLGLIKNNSTGAQAALISINGQSRLVKAGEVIENVVFKSFTRDSLVAKWGKEKLIIRK